MRGNKTQKGEPVFPWVCIELTVIETLSIPASCLPLSVSFSPLTLHLSCSVAPITVCLSKFEIVCYITSPALEYRV